MITEQSIKLGEHALDSLGCQVLANTKLIQLEDDLELLFEERACMVHVRQCVILDILPE